MTQLLPDDHQRSGTGRIILPDIWSGKAVTLQVEKIISGLTKFLMAMPYNLFIFIN